MVSLKDARYQVLKNLFGPLVTDRLVPTEVVGEANIPARGPGLLVLNHRSLMDPYLFSARTRRVVNWVTAPFVASLPAFGWLAEQAGAIPMLKGEKGKSETLLETIDGVWRQGRLVGIFPEGMDNFLKPVDKMTLGQFHGTFMRAVLASRIPHLPVIPAAIYPRREGHLGDVSGSFLQMFDQSESTFKHGELHLVGYQEALVLIGKPLTFDEFYGQYRHHPDRHEPPEQTALVERLVGTVRESVNELLVRADMLEAPTTPQALGHRARLS